MIGGALALAWSAGALDEPLSSVGLNSETCIENAFGNKTCGDDAVRFCRKRYDRDLNGDVCDDVLTEAGIDPKKMLAERRRRARAAARRRLERNRTRVKIGEAGTDDGVSFTVTALDQRESIDGDYDNATPKAGNIFIVAKLSYTNDGTKPIDLLCSITAGTDGAVLVDGRDRQFSPDTDATSVAPANEEACGDDVQPGDTEDAELVFDVSDSTQPKGLVLWNPDKAGPEDGGTFLAIPTPSR